MCLPGAPDYTDIDPGLTMFPKNKAAGGFSASGPRV
jgi:hypothetical protein